MNFRIALATAAVLMLSACSGGSEPAPPPANDVMPEGEIVNEPEVINAIPAPAANEATPAPAPTPVAEEVTKAREEQMYDDADATGMTARVDRSADTTEQPAEKK